MNCPKCNREMIEGHIPSFRAALRWYPKDEIDYFVFSNPSAKGGIKLTNFPWVKASRKTAFNCSNCRLIIMSY